MNLWFTGANNTRCFHVLWTSRPWWLRSMLQPSRGLHPGRHLLLQVMWPDRLRQLCFYPGRMLPANERVVWGSKQKEWSCHQQLQECPGRDLAGSSEVRQENPLWCQSELCSLSNDFVQSLNINASVNACNLNQKLLHLPRLILMNLHLKMFFSTLCVWWKKYLEIWVACNFFFSSVVASQQLDDMFAIQSSCNTSCAQWIVCNHRFQVMLLGELHLYFP